jgi:hypothetical protein
VNVIRKSIAALSSDFMNAQFDTIMNLVAQRRTVVGVDCIIERKPWDDCGAMRNLIWETDKAIMAGNSPLKHVSVDRLRENALDKSAMFWRLHVTAPRQTASSPFNRSALEHHFSEGADGR